MPEIQCDQCDRQFTAPAEYAGQKVQCPNCHAYVRVPVRPASVTHPALESISTGVRLLKWGLAALLAIVVGYVLLALYIKYN